MRICRYQKEDASAFAFYFDGYVIPLAAAATAAGQQVPETDQIIDYLHGGVHHEATKNLYEWLQAAPESEALRISVADTTLLVPNPRPNKLFLLAGNYAKHIEEGGEKAAERAETFPYVFMKPPTTSLCDPGKSIQIPKVSPDQIDWELELAVVIGRECRGVSEDEASQFIAGYTIVNDISDRHFRPNPNRKERPKDGFFDWLHGKWHDRGCPCGPCVVSAETLPNVQSLAMRLAVNGHVFQDASTAQQIFPVAAVVEFVSSFVTLEPGDIISTGTPHGVGKSTNTFLKPGDEIEASIESIGTLQSFVEAEA